ncbi:MAG: hypothetical protein ACFCA4_11000 [Cyanophyceae cyanobacterium]
MPHSFIGLGRRSPFPRCKPTYVIDSSPPMSYRLPIYSGDGVT